MHLSPKAYRLVAEAVQSLAFEQCMVWHEWSTREQGALSTAAALVAQEALRLKEQKLREALEADSLDEDAEADLANDLGFISAIERDLTKSLEPGHRS